MSQQDTEMLLVIGVFSGVIPTFLLLACFLVKEAAQEGWRWLRGRA